MLNKGQTGDRKQRSVINTVITLTHDIQQANNKGKMLSCLLLNVKGLFDHLLIQ